MASKLKQGKKAKRKTMMPWEAGQERSGVVIFCIHLEGRIGFAMDWT